MIVVDTTVWVDFINDRDEPQGRTFVESIERHSTVRFTLYGASSSHTWNAVSPS